MNESKKRMYHPQAILLVMLMIMGGIASGKAQAPQPVKNQTPSDSKDTKKTAKPKNSDTPAQDSALSADSAPEAAKPAASPKAPRTANATTVWVNTATGVYHQPGSRWYGKTKQGKYMTEADAIKAGFHAAGKS